ncbi:MAG: M55 family metallopeptidase [Firmicutes bacterium]|nr:M55 family metallopeptidase [Bacillota bacterium]MDD4693783.1 M55 family metallopeptidase [Bacillota bacterium]
MKILIAADMEGISGVADRSFVLEDGLNYELGRFLMESDVNAAIDGAIASGATEILVVDGHDGGHNLRITNLNSRAVLLTGSARPFPMITGYEEADAAIFIGYHAQFGTSLALLDHTYTSRLKLWINNVEAGESYMNALLCGSKNVPVILYSGDQALAEEVRSFSPDSFQVVVKEAYGRSAAGSLNPQKSGFLIKENVKKALKAWQDGHIKPVTTTDPVEIKVQFIVSEMAEQAAVLPGAEQIDPLTVVSIQPNIELGVRAFLAMIALAKAPLF